MITIIMSIICFVCIFYFFYHELNKFKTNKTFVIFASLLLATPSLNVASILFIFEIHFIIFILILEFIFKYLHKLHQNKYRIIILFSSFILSFIIIMYGLYNMNHIVKTSYSITSTKNLKNDYKIVMISDIHYPTSLNSTKLNQLVNQILKENPDYVMLCGDITDEYTSNSQKDEVFKTLGQLTHIADVFYVYGNHDLGNYSIHNKTSCNEFSQLIESYGIQVLNDEQITLNNEITLIGRKDYNLHNRKSIDSYNINKNTYNIILDHQPKELKECSKNKIDLHLSGHTHSGQIFPLYYIFELFNINELNYGIEPFNQMNAINTSGVSGWGFPVRTQQHSEYVIINII